MNFIGDRYVDIGGGRGESYTAYRDYRGVPVLGAWHWNEKLGLGFVAEMDESEVLEMYYQARDAIFIVLTVAFFLCIWFVLGIQRVHKKSETELLRKEAYMRMIMGSALDSIITIDEKGIVESFNLAAEKLFGYASTEVIGQNIKMLMPPPFRHQHDGYLANFLSTGKARIIGIGREVEGLRKDGSIFPMRLGVNEFYIENRRVFTGIIQDLTEEKKVMLALQESEEKFRKMAGAAQSAIVMIDSDSLVNFWNAAAERIFGWNIDEVIGLDAHTLLATEDSLEASQKGMKNFLLTGEGSKVGKNRELLARRKDGSELNIELALSSVTINGEWQAIAIINDITERKALDKELKARAEQLLQLNENLENSRKAAYSLMQDIDIQRQRAEIGVAKLEKSELALRESKNHLNNMLDTAPVIIFEKDLSGKYLYTNPAFEKATGLAREQVLGHTDKELFAAEIAETFMKNDCLAIAQKEPLQTEEVLVTGKDRSYYWATKYALRDTESRVYSVAGWATDITRVKQAQETLDYKARFEELVSKLSARFINIEFEQIDKNIELSLQRLSHFIDADAGFVFLLNDNNRHFDMSHSWFEVDADLDKEGFKQLDIDFIPWSMKSLLLGKPVLIDSVGELPHEALHEKEMLQQLGIHAVIDVPMIFKDKVIGFVGFASRGTEHVWTENEVKLLSTAGRIIVNALHRKEVEHNLIIAKDQANSANVAKSEFLAIMSHEIRTPMNAIIGLSHLSLKMEMPSKQRNYIEKVQRSAETLLVIINDILDFSKIEAGQLQIETVDFQRDTMLDNVVNLLGLKAEEKQLEFVLDVDPRIPNNLQGDALRLGQVMLNFGGNAIKFTEQGEIILAVKVLEIDDTQTKLQFSVRDTGVGINLEQQKQLFQPFSQADASITRKYGGTGLGLAISKQLVELMGGEVWLESVPGEGSTFYFTALLGIKPEIEQSDTMLFDVFSGIKVLVVDDNVSSGMILQKMLESYGFEVTVLHSGVEAIKEVAEQAAINNSYRLILIDWLMPEQDGLEVVRHVQQHTEFPPMIIMLTSYGVEEMLSQAGDVELNGVLIKPVTPSSLLDSVFLVLEGEVHSAYTYKDTSDENGTALASLKGASILLVEDNEFNQELAVEILTDADISVQVANNGLEALQLLDKQPFDGVLMDLQMPIMDGFTATQKIRKQQKFIDLPVIAMTANAMVGDKESVLEAGMNDYISKPINISEMFNIMAKWIKPSKETRDVVTVNKAVEVIKGMPAIEDINIQEGLRRASLNEKLYQKLLTKFSTNYIGFVSDFQSALDDENDALAKRLIHTFKGVAGTIGADQLRIEAAELEREFKQGEDVGVCLDKIDKSLQRVIKSIDELSFPETDEKAEDKSPVDANELTEIVSELSSLVNQYNTRAIDFIEQYGDKLKPILKGNDKKQLIKALENYDFDTALKTLDSMRERQILLKFS
ncbi:MAG: PAS domain S-box protein [Methylomarinum sp.]|nr:PAS domain S-box protein [Methylomarinum sp.]